VKRLLIDELRIDKFAKVDLGKPVESNRLLALGINMSHQPWPINYDR